MTQFIVRRLLVTIPVLIGIVFIVFVLARIVAGRPVPGGPGRAGHRRGLRRVHHTATASTRRSSRASSRPTTRSSSTSSRHPAVPARQPVRRLPRWQLAQGDLGDSIKLSRPVTTLLIERLPTTVELTLMALLFAVVIGDPARDSSRATGTTPGPTSGRWSSRTSACPSRSSCSGLMLAYLFAVVLKDTPLVAATVGPAQLGRRRDPARRRSGA